MNVDYSMLAATGIMNSVNAADICEPDALLRDVKDGDQMTCITLNSGVILTIPSAYLRITGPRQLRGVFDAHIAGRLETNIMYTVSALDIADIDYFIV